MATAPNGSTRRRVLILDQGEGLWGPQQSLLRLAPLLEARGFELRLAAPAGPLAAAWQSAGRPYEHVPAGPARSVRTASGRLSVPKAARELVRTLASATRVARLARASRIDVIVTNNHWSHLEGVLAGRLARVPVVVYLHEHHQDDALGRLRRFAVVHSARTVAVSDSIRRALPETARAQVEVIRNGVAPPEPVSRGTVDALRDELGTSGRVVLALARYQEEKGLDDLIRATALLPAAFDDVVLVLAGGSRPGDGHEQSLRRLADDDLPGRTRFLGFRTDARVLLELADVCALPSRVEALPLVMLEAQAAGCPIVASAAGGIPEVVEHEVTGLLFPPGDVARLAAELERVLGDAELRERLRRNGLEHVAAEGSIDRQSDRLAQLLRSVT